MKVAILDDYQNVTLKLADWSAVRRRAEISVFNDDVADTAAVVERLRPFDVVCVMRERTSLTRKILQQLPQPKLIASTGPRNVSIDTQTANDLGIAVTATGYDSTPTNRVHLVADPGEHATPRSGSRNRARWRMAAHHRC
jgi:phosphoglycerate dehydrogenase-like enzyme